MNFKE